MYHLFVRSKPKTFYVFLKIIKTMHWRYKSSYKMIKVLAKFFHFIESGENEENMCSEVNRTNWAFYEFDYSNP